MAKFSSMDLSSLLLNQYYEAANDLKTLVDVYKTEAKAWGKHITQMDIGKKVGSVFTSLRSHPALSDNVIWITMVLGVALIICYLQLHKYQAYLRARNCKVIIEWNETSPNRVGGLANVKISFLEFPDTESVRDLLKEVTVEVLLDDEEIILEKDTCEEEQFIFVKFPVNKSGTYKVYIWCSGFPVTGSPFCASIEPETLDPSKSCIGAKNPIIVVKGRQFKIDIIPNDSYGNRCSTSVADMRRLSFKVQKWTQPLETSTTSLTTPVEVNTTDFQCCFGARRADTSSDPNFLPIYTLYGKCLGIGMYDGVVLYEDIPLALPSQKIEFISISPEEEAMVLDKEYLGSFEFNALRTLSMQTPEYSENDDESEANLESGSQSSIPPHVNVKVELSPRFMYLKQDLDDGPFTLRLSTLRMGKNTTMDLISIQDAPAPESHLIQITDSVQNLSEKILMTGSEARVFMTLFYEYMSDRESSNQKSLMAVKLSNFRGLELKQYTLYKGIRDTYVPSPTSVQSYRIIKVRREYIIETTLEETRNFTREDWGKPFVVTFYSEPVKADGLAWLEWSELLMNTFFESNAHGMFLANSSGLIHPNPNKNSRWIKEHYELAGKVVGKYLVETALDKNRRQYFVDARFSRSFLGLILSVKPTYQNMELDDPEEYISTVYRVLTQDVTNMDLHFAVRIYDQFGNAEVRELIPNGKRVSVTNDNKIDYLNALANLRLTVNVQEEVEAFVSGLTLLVPDRLLMMFEENELELMLCGSSTFSIRDVQLHHISSGEWNPNASKITEWLWTALSDMSALDIGRFLQFVAGSSRLPKGGFVELKPRLKISFSALFGQLPSANKTLHHLCLTDHKNYPDFLQSLTTAIRGSSCRNC